MQRSGLLELDQEGSGVAGEEVHEEGRLPPGRKPQRCAGAIALIHSSIHTVVKHVHLRLGIEMIFLPQADRTARSDPFPRSCRSLKHRLDGDVAGATC